MFHPPRGPTRDNSFKYFGDRPDYSKFNLTKRCIIFRKKLFTKLATHIGRRLGQFRWRSRDYTRVLELCMILTIDNIPNLFTLLNEYMYYCNDILHQEATVQEYFTEFGEWPGMTEGPYGNYSWFIIDIISTETNIQYTFTLSNNNDEYLRPSPTMMRWPYLVAGCQQFPNQSITYTVPIATKHGQVVHHGKFIIDENSRLFHTLCIQNGISYPIFSDKLKFTQPLMFTCRMMKVFNAAPDLILYFHIQDLVRDKHCCVILTYTGDMFKILFDFPINTHERIKRIVGSFPNPGDGRFFDNEAMRRCFAYLVK
jgi:hypothetical protein